MFALRQRLFSGNRQDRSAVVALAMGKRVLIVEDDELVGDHLAELLREQLACVPLVARASGEGLSLADGVDFGILDIEVSDGVTFPLAAKLRERGIPFAFVSARDPARLPPEFAGAPYLRKPVSAPQLLAVAREHL
jgi:DNA-binding response OmpR family regulator